MFNARNRIVKKDKSPPTEVENEIAKCLFDIEFSISSELKTDVRDIVIAAAKDVEIDGRKKAAVVIIVPYRVYRDNVQSIQGRLISELEKKTKRHVVIVGRRSILLNKDLKRKGLKILPRSRTLTSVHDSLLEDIVSPTEVVGKRLLVKPDGSKLWKIHLDPKDKQKDNLEEKLDTFAAVYRKLTGRIATFIFPNHIY